MSKHDDDDDEQPYIDGCSHPALYHDEMLPNLQPMEKANCTLAAKAIIEECLVYFWKILNS